MQLPDQTDDYDRLALDAMNVGAQTALVEAHRLLTLRQMPEAAEALLAHHSSILARCLAMNTAAMAIDRARNTAGLTLT